MKINDEIVYLLHKIERIHGNAPDSILDLFDLETKRQIPILSFKTMDFLNKIFIFNKSTQSFIDSIKNSLKKEIGNLI